jgi:tRNA (adenine22-N1)-methyltransferase
MPQLPFAPPAAAADSAAPGFGLGARLEALLAVIRRFQPRHAYDEIWDCCCDHGYLGMKILQENLCEQVNFVDRVASITAQVSAVLARHLAHIEPQRRAVLTADAGALTLTPGRRHLLVLAGIGGLLASKIMATVRAANPGVYLDFLCCPATTQYDLREYMVQAGLGLHHEESVVERQRLYEIVLVSNTRGDLPAVSLTGACWTADAPQHLAYLRKLHRHYVAQSQGRDAARAAPIARCYADALARLQAGSPAGVATAGV